MPQKTSTTSSRKIDKNKPILIINTKSYKEATYPYSLLLGQISEKISSKLNVQIALAVQPTDIYLLSHRFSLPILAQHFDPVEEKATGAVSGYAIKSAGAIGSLINHSERKLTFNGIRKRIEYAKGLDLTTIVCASNMQEVREIVDLNPDFIAIEPPELIGGNISVSKARPELLKEFVDFVRSHNPNIGLICGAGIKTGEDVTRALDLGVKGILVASGIVLSHNWEEKIKELASHLI